MKPILVFIESNNKQKDIITITKQELESIVSNAYDQGYTDGSKYSYYPTWYSTTSSPPNPYVGVTYTGGTNAKNQSN